MATNNSKISIYRILHDGVMPISKRDIPQVEHTMNATPRNLLKALKLRAEFHAENVRCYGSVGGGRTGITIDGIDLDQENYIDIDMKYSDFQSRLGEATRIIREYTTVARA